MIDYEDTYNGAGIYAITNKTNGKQYIGSSVHIADRIRQHANDITCGRHYSKDMIKDFQNGDAFTAIVLEKTDIIEITYLRDMEHKHIQKAKDGGIVLYNIATVYGGFTTAETLLYLLADICAREHFGKSFNLLTKRKQPYQLDELRRQICALSVEVKERDKKKA